jgi:hypothetical protein
VEVVGRKKVEHARRETRQTKRERIRNRRKGWKQKRESRAGSTRSQSISPADPSGTARRGSFGSSLKLLHARRSWRKFKRPGTCGNLARKRKQAHLTRSEKRRACMMHVMHTCRSSLRSAEHLFAPQGTTRQPTCILPNLFEFNSAYLKYTIQ